MDSKYNFIGKFKNFIDSCDEVYLIDAANKGLYKRALKEIDKGIEVDVEFQDNKVICKLSDETTCELTDEILNYKCRCSSRSICKHVLISILYIKQNIDSIFGQEIVPEGNEDEQPKDFSWVLNYSIEDIKKEMSSKNFKDIIFRLNFGRDIEIKEENFLVVDFKDSNIRVRFTQNSSIDKSTCTCKKKEFCVHRAEAIICYKLYKNILDMNDINEAVDVKISKEALDEVKNLIEEITILGLAKIPESIINRIEATAVLCHSADLPRLEKLLRSLSSHLIKYFNKQASFSKRAVIKLMTRIYIIAQTILKCNSKALCQDLIGEHKTSYTEISLIELVGMGAKAWKSDSGYEGITYYFFNEKRKLWMTFTSMKPNYYEGSKIDIDYMYRSSCPWNLDALMKDVCRMKIKFNNCKINRNYRISSSSEISGDIIGKTDINKMDFKDKLYDDWELMIEKLKDGFKYKLIEKDENFNIVLVKISSWGKSDFDNINQIFRIPIHDKNNNEIFITVRFDHNTKSVIRKLEKLEKDDMLGNMILGKVYRIDSEYVVDPITMYNSNGDIVNLTLD
ncbi:hypothetical protein [Tepidibacter hydrothermalis]|uniref:SWIM-type domain-containing protein n=1 Tax=Tepidibacter hydrothermalis TaxID=3036126 RepID=A0ABY8ED60_9FIRM|nr:hypothetical protein [Tepidibacter hydrothermalis]WFD09719.1 hypothetical protein P4S50_15175 [Tepidibacter hydrothermalis]